MNKSYRIVRRAEVAFHTCGMREGIDEPQVGQPASGWRKIDTGAQPSPPSCERLIFKQQPGRRRQIYRTEAVQGRRGSASRGRARYLGPACLQDKARAGICRPHKTGPGADQGSCMQVWQDCAWCGPGQTHAGLAGLGLVLNTPSARRAGQTGTRADQHNRWQGWQNWAWC